MEQVLATVGAASAPTLLLTIAFLFFRGKVVAESVVDRIIAAKNEALAQQKIYYEKIIKDLEESHAERRTDLKQVADINARALQTAVDNAQKLISQNDDLLEVARTAAPAILAARQAAEAIGNGS